MIISGENRIMFAIYVSTVHVSTTYQNNREDQKQNNFNGKCTQNLSLIDFIF